LRWQARRVIIQQLGSSGEASPQRVKGKGIDDHGEIYAKKRTEPSTQRGFCKIQLYFPRRESRGRERWERKKAQKKKSRTLRRKKKRRLPSSLRCIYMNGKEWGIINDTVSTTSKYHSHNHHCRCLDHPQAAPSVFVPAAAHHQRPAAGSVEYFHLQYVPGPSLNPP